MKTFFPKIGFGRNVDFYPVISIGFFICFIIITLEIKSTSN